MSSKNLPGGPYSITRDLVKDGFLFTLKLYGAQLASHKWALPYAPDWMTEKQTRGNIAAMEGTLHSQAPTFSLVNHAGDTVEEGVCRAAT